jgi:hypothetical protein
MNISACGLICDECEHFNVSCTGCHMVKGQTFWAKEMMPTKTCPLYDCGINSRKFTDCGECKELPCSLFVQMKDPNSTDEQHKEMLVKRVDILKGLHS